MRTTSSLLFTLLLAIQLNGQQRSNFARKEVLTDLESLFTALIDAHYNVYAYTSKADFKATYAKLKGSVTKDSLTLLEANLLFQQLAAAVNNGHTSLDFPGQEYVNYAYAGGIVFPLELAFEDNKALVRKNWSGNGAIAIGDEVMAINGVAIVEILQQIYPLISAERPYFKDAKIELYSFPRYYWLVFGRQDNFTVQVRAGDEITSHELKAVDVIAGYEMKRTEVLNPALKLEFLDGAAYLNPGGFGGEVEAYRRFIDSAFSVIKSHETKNLIIDLRNNPGGDDAFSDYLVSYIADEPFNWNSNFTLKTSAILKAHVRRNSDTTTRYAQAILGHENGETFAFRFDEYQPQPAEKRFTGNVYVLVNRQSHSQSAVTAAQIQDYGFGTIVGEETAEYPSLYASIFQYNLPITGLTVHISKGYIVRINGSTKQEGVIPDIVIRDHLLDETDEILEGVLKTMEND